MYLFEENFDKGFHYPLEGNVLQYARQMQNKQIPNVQPINSYDYNFIHNPNHKCLKNSTIQLLILVKSSTNNFKQREIIRKTWGYEGRFSDINIRTVFLLGKSKLIENDLKNFTNLLEMEVKKSNDIVQSDFIDDYYNNTVKTMRGFQWAVEYCSNSKFYLFVDDDYYVSVKNVLRYVRDPIHYPNFLNETEEVFREISNKIEQKNYKFNEMELKLIKLLLTKDAIHTVESKNLLEKIKKSDVIMKLVFPKQDLGLKRKRRDIFERELPGHVRLFSGFVVNSTPHRHIFSRWYVDLNEYKWHKWPTYVTAGSFILSNKALFDMYYVSKYTKHFRFDDIFLGIVARKAYIEPLHSERFHFDKLPYTGPDSYKYAITSHGYKDADELSQIWSLARAAGHA